MRVAILYHPKLPHSQELAREISTFLLGRGHEAWLGSSWDVRAIEAQLPGSDLILTLGGDGTILRAARVAVGSQAAILGINLGRFGFLAELQPEEWQAGLCQALAGDGWVEERMMLQTEHCREGQTMARHHSLNEVVVSRGRLARVVRVDTYVDGTLLAHYVADGLIAATPTGSTAYAFAAGGPIMPPDLRNILLVPIAPMFGFTRPVVLSEGTEVRFVVSTDHEAILTIDGQFDVQLQNGDEVLVQSSQCSARFLRLRPPSYFYKTLSQKFGELRSPWLTNGMDEPVEQRQSPASCTPC